MSMLRQIIFEIIVKKILSIPNVIQSLFSFFIGYTEMHTEKLYLSQIKQL